MSLEVAKIEYDRFLKAKHIGKKISDVKSGQSEWDESREKEFAKRMKNGESVTQLIKREHVSGRKLIEIKKKYGLWGA